MLYASPSQHILLFFSNVLYARHSLNWRYSVPQQ
jgi:hypothetical protein